MESEIEILLKNNKKLKLKKNYLILDEIRKFIKKEYKEYKIPDQSFIELFDENFSEISSVRDLEKLIAESNNFNACIRLNFMVRPPEEKIKI